MEALEAFPNPCPYGIFEPLYGIEALDTTVSNNVLQHSFEANSLMNIKHKQNQK